MWSPSGLPYPDGLARSRINESYGTVTQPAPGPPRPPLPPNWYVGAAFPSAWASVQRRAWESKYTARSPEGDGVTFSSSTYTSVSRALRSAMTRP